MYHGKLHWHSPHSVLIEYKPNRFILADILLFLPIKNTSLSSIQVAFNTDSFNSQNFSALLRECRRILCPGKTLTLNKIELKSDFSGGDPVAWTDPPQTGVWGIDSLHTMLRAVGFEVPSQPAGEQLQAIRTDRRKCSESGYRNAFSSNQDTNYSEPIPESHPLVSILIPAYKADFFREALESVCSQSYKNCECIICDDSPDDSIRNIVDEYSNSPISISYYKNRERIWGKRNYAQCIELSQGEYCKFVNDDDLIGPECVEKMVTVLERYPECTLVTSRRSRIDEKGDVLPDIPATLPPSAGDVIIDGGSVITKIAPGLFNFVGEPTSTLFRRRDVLKFNPLLVGFAGRDPIRNCDMALWITLLSQGDLCYLAETMSSFRTHPGQRQNDVSYRERIRDAVMQFRDGARILGCLRICPVQVLPMMPLSEPVSSTDHLQPFRQMGTARAFYNRGNKSRALRLAYEASKKVPSYRDALILMADIFNEAKDLQSAVTTLTSVLTFYPEDTLTLFRLARLFADIGDHATVQILCDRIQLLVPYWEEPATFSQTVRNLYSDSPESNIGKFLAQCRKNPATFGELPKLFMLRQQLSQQSN
ncbi:MAG: glycosyltransferase [Chitinivibrionales bacterium]|nr:glycosyltransferase [Chitinivibrionales bacterium]